MSVSSANDDIIPLGAQPRSLRTGIQELAKRRDQISLQALWRRVVPALPAPLLHTL